MRVTINASKFICGITAAAVLAGTGVLFLRLKPYWVAKHRGRGADLHGTVLVYAPLAGARYDKNTRWPAGFDPTKHGAVLVE